MPSSEPSTTLPEFTPVPREKDRSNGWKPETQRAFIAALAETGSVKSAARRVGRAEVGAYLLRRHPEAEEFRRAWDAALDIGMRRIEDVAMERALNGVEVPVYSYGKLLGSRTVYNDRLLMFMLRNRASERFAGGGAARGPDAIDAMKLKRLQRQWRKAWEDARDAEQAADSAQLRAAIEAQLDHMQEHYIAAMSPRTRRLYDALQASQRLDRLRRSRRYALALPPQSGARLWDGVDLHPPRNTLADDYLQDELGPRGAEEAAQAHHAEKLAQRGVLGVEADGAEE